MLNQKHLFSYCGMMLALVALTGDVAARTRKGDTFLKNGRIAEAKGNWDAALESYERAVGEDPTDTGYVIAMRKARFEAGQKHVDLGKQARAAGKLEDALQEFEKALIADPSSAIALQDIRQTENMMRAPQAGAKPEDAGLTAVDRARKDRQEHVESMLAPPQLKPMTAVIPMLKMNNQPPKVLFETVGKLGGISVIFDSQYNAPGRNFNVDLNNATIDQAFDYLATLTRTFWKPLNPTTIFVAEDNVTKRRDYEDDVVRVFYITNATSVQEFQEIATAIRTVAEIRRVFTYNAQRAMIVRDTVDKVALAEKLVHDLDKPKSEVVVDVLVLQANSERTRDLAATIATAGVAGLNIPINFDGTTSTSATPAGTGTGIGAIAPAAAAVGSIPLSGLAHLALNQFSTSLPGGLLQALLADSRTRVLNNPQVRASDGQKVTLKIGQRIPYATGSFGSAIGGVGAGVSPLVSTQFNYADVGVNIDMTPQVHSADEVTLHIEVTVSSVQQYVSIGGISQPVIGQNANIADVRLREGEVNILGGLNQTQDTANSNGIPGLVSIPVLGKIFFGNDHTDKARSDLLIALVPHIVRTPDYTAENLRGVYVGTDQVVKINYAPKAGENGAPPQGAAPQGSSRSTPSANPAPAPPKPASNLAPAPAPTPALAPVPAPPSNPTAGGVAPTPAPVPAPAAVVAQLRAEVPAAASNAPSPAENSPANTMEGGARVGFLPELILAPVGSAVIVNVELKGAANIASVGTLRIRYNPAQLRLNEISPGDLLSPDGAVLNTVKEIHNEAGEATISIARPAGAPPVTGTGAIAGLTFTALAPGSSPVAVAELNVLDGQGHAIAAALGELPVTVQPVTAQ
ncbi:MAG TPA: cohesin domain-containing protein [Bryobacteraceae bacterium]|nr:cohesin domain-containing protein [Bryobacteraceae bacterium]